VFNLYQHVLVLKLNYQIWPYFHGALFVNETRDRDGYVHWPQGVYVLLPEAGCKKHGLHQGDHKCLFKYRSTAHSFVLVGFFLNYEYLPRRLSPINNHNSLQVVTSSTSQRVDPNTMTFGDTKKTFGEEVTSH
jgi:hypothetical protein